MSKTAKAHRLLLMEIRQEQDVVLSRQRGRQFAEALGFPPQTQIRISTALSEIARNAFRYAGGGRVDFSVETEPRFATPAKPQQILAITVSDSGPGIENLDEILGGSYRSRTGLGLGILGARRLMDRVDVATSTSGTTITLRKMIPANSAIRDPSQLQAVVDELLRQAPASALDEMRVQNQELLRAMEDARAREEEISRINQELAETNSGVLALYDELETLHRVSVLMGSQLELKALIQSMIDVTTDLTSADLAAFYFRVEQGNSWSVYATAGPDCEALQVSGPAVGPDFFGVDFARVGLVRIGDLDEEPGVVCASNFARLIAANFKVRSCLIVPILGPDAEVSGAMVFASRRPGHFTERSERIVSSIAAQAVIGIEKSRLYQTVKASNEAKDRFLAMLSHELRTPLNPVLAIVSSWHGDPRVPAELQEEVAVVARNVRLEARLIDDLLDFNKLINGKLEIDHSPVDLHGLIDSVIAICREDLAAEELDLQMNLAAGRCTVAGDAARLQQVLWNVLKNAIKFTSRQGVISVVTSNPEPETVRIVVSDNGRGIDPGVIGRIFGAFEQGQPQVLARFGGLGLGLAIAKTFVERHSGTITATSEGLGRGSQFTIDLPISHQTVPARGTADDLSGKFERIQNSRILLVEDHADTLSTMTRLLTRKGYVVAMAADGSEARREFSAAPFDMIISDLGLPDCSGLELIGELRAITPTPAIALSGYGMEADISNSRAAGFEAHLTKPIDFELLINTVGKILERTMAPEAAG